MLRLRQTEAYSLICGMDQSAFESALMDVLQSVDTEQTGVLGRPDIRTAIYDGMTMLSGKQVQALMSLAEPNEDAGGGVLYEQSIMPFAFATLQHIQEQEMLASS